MKALKYQYNNTGYLIEKRKKRKEKNKDKYFLNCTETYPYGSFNYYNTNPADVWPGYLPKHSRT